jgi:3-oxoacyl-[acyl-carrier protein] reductase
MSSGPAAAAVYADLRGKVALVTGGSKGIGAETCRLLAANGARVMVCARGRDAIDGLVEELRAAGGDAHGCVADATVLAELEAARAATEESLGPIDVLVPFAGGFSSYTPIHEISEAEWRAVLDANLTSTFLTIKACLPGMLVRRRGSIVTMASNAARLVDVPLTASYAAAKAGIVQLTRHVALEVAERGVRVNCVAPATTMSERLEAIMSDELRERITALSPLGRLGAPADSAHAALFLASDVSGWMTGVTIDVAGGRVML